LAGRLIPEPFTYPQKAHERRHGPAGWRDYRRYRPWLRDDFSFRCVFCLFRELWNDSRRANPVDHFIPRALRPDRTSDYENLLYVCPGCNGIKSDSLVPDPCRVPFGKCLEVKSDGSIQALDNAGEGQRLIDELLLDHPKFNQLRRRVIKILKICAKHDWAEFLAWMRFPEDLPDLAQDMPPSNTRPDGIAHSWFAKRQRGELPEVY
jgi:hypothetical protein